MSSGGGSSRICRRTSEASSGQTTAVSTLGYEAQRLERTRDELRRQNSLLEVENARLDSPARIETQASKLGLVRAASVPVVNLDTITAKR